MLRELRLCLWVMALAALLTAPALADDDPFRNAAPPAPVVVPKPAPRPQPREEPVAAPRPSPSRFSAAYVARVRAVAQSQAVGMADDISFRYDVVPDQYRAWIGAWGPGFWSGGVEAIVVVQAIDAAGNVDMILGWGGKCGQGWRKAGGRMQDGKIYVTYSRDSPTCPEGPRVEVYSMWTGDSVLGAMRVKNGQIVLPRLQ